MRAWNHDDELFEQLVNREMKNGAAPDAELNELCDKRVKIWNTESGSSRRQPSPLGELTRAEAAQNWYAAAFHLGWLLRERPDDEPLKARHEEALARLKETGTSAPPPPSSAAALSPGSIDPR
jgi:hypothetical protein